MRFSVILNTYNRAHFLPLVLAAWRRLARSGFTMIVADDGSEDHTTELLRELAPTLPYPLVHVRHERRGHRRAEILNKAVHVAEDEPLLFTDADSLPATDLLAVHTRHFTPARLLCGGYIRLSEDTTLSVTPETAAAGRYEAELTPEWRRRLAWQHRKNQLYVLLRKKRRPHNMGLNMVLPRSAYLEINGYDNEFRGWGKADGDLRERLKRIGVRPYSVWDSALVFHLHHPPDPTKKAKANQTYAERREVALRSVSGYAEVKPEVVFRSAAASDATG